MILYDVSLIEYTVLVIEDHRQKPFKIITLSLTPCNPLVVVSVVHGSYLKFSLEC